MEDEVGGGYKAAKEDVPFSPLQTAHKNHRREFQVTDRFKEALSDAGAVFQHPSKRGAVSIEDVFVYPDVRFIDREDEDAQRISARAFETIGDDGTYVLIKGEEKCGKTTLAFQLFKSFYAAGLVPVYIDAADVVQAGNREVNKIIGKAIDSEYGDGAAKRYFELEIGRRVLLLDNFELLPVPEKYRHKVLQHLHKEFRHIFILSNDIVQLDELFMPGAGELLKLYRCCELLRYGHKLRYELINKWNSIGEDSGLARGDVLALNSEAEKMVNGIIGKNFVPSLPLYLLTILQSIEARKPSQILQNGWGHYYHFLIVQALLSAGVREKDVAEIVSYLCELAYRYFSRDQKELSEGELKEFNTWFSTEFTSIEFAARRDLLVKAKILEKHGSAYGFRYPYIYYYFAAQYLAAHMQEEEIRKKVRYLCSHAYVLEFANIVVFLAHHTSDALVVEELIALSKHVFGSLQPVQLEDDVSGVNKAVDQVPQLVYRGGDPEEKRREVARLRDELEEPADPLLEASPETTLDALSLPAKINLAFKTSEILGQIVRNNYGSMRKNAKVSILCEAYDGPLRALRSLYDELTHEPEELLKWIEHWLKEERPHATDEQRQELARRWFFGVLTALGANFVRKIADAVGSENLKDEYALLLKERRSLSYRLVDAAIKLDIPKALPFAEITRIAEDVKSNAMGFRVLQTLVIRHLHMFKTSDIEKQKLCAAVGIQVPRQRGIDIVTKNTKLMKKR